MHAALLRRTFDYSHFPKITSLDVLVQSNILNSITIGFFQKCKLLLLSIQVI